MKKTLIFLLTLMSCSPETMSYLYHDHQNPCKEGQPYYNKEECERWQEMEPKEYQKYLTRIKQQNK